MRKPTSTNAANEAYLQQVCPMQYTLALIGGRWKILLLWYVHLGANRFSLLKKRIPASGKMIGQQLKELEQSGLLAKTSYAEALPHVEYSLTAKAHRLLPLLQALNAWGRTEMAADNELVLNTCERDNTGQGQAEAFAAQESPVS